MQQINVNELKPHPRNTEFFDDMSDEKWKEFLDSVKSRGVIEPIVITPDKTIVSGHQRTRACKELGIDFIMCDVHTYDNEDQILQDLLETNIRQRGDVGGSAKKVGLRIKELERLYGIRDGSSNNIGTRVGEKNSFTQKDLAKNMDIDVRTLQNYKVLAEMIPELSDLVDTGIVTKTTALAMMKALSSEEQEEFISSMDITKKITQKQVQSYIDKIKQLESQPPKTIEKKIEIDNTDYSLTDKNKRLQEDVERLKRENLGLKSINQSLEKSKEYADSIANTYKKQSEEYMTVKSKIIDMGLDPNGEYNLYSAASEIAKLTKDIEEFLLDKLAPTKYKGFMIAVKNSDVMRSNFNNTLNSVKEWYEEMINYVTENETKVNYDIVDMEEK